MARPRPSSNPPEDASAEQPLTWAPRSLNPDLPPYLALLEALDADIASGALPAGSQLPPHRVLAAHLGWSLSTITKAYREAGARGLATGRVGQGTFVTRPAAVQHAAPADGFVHFEVNLAPDIGQRQVLQATMQSVLADTDRDQLFAYNAHQGLLGHRAMLAEWISTSAFRPPVDRVFATNGAQHGLDIALSIAARPGAPILVEELTYVGFKALAALHEHPLVPVAIDGEGMVPEALDRQLRASGSRTVYAMPTLHSPTGRTMSKARRAEIAQIIARHDAILIEDDVYGFLPDPRAEPIAALIPDRTIYLASLSKVFELGLRAGVAVVPPALIDKALLAMRAGAWSATPLLFETCGHLLGTGQFDQIVMRLRDEMRRRIAIFQRTFPEQSLPWQGGICGYHVWLEIPAGISAEDVYYTARNRGVLITPPGSASVSGVAEVGLRLCLGACPATDLERGLGILRRILEQPNNAFLSVV